MLIITRRKGQRIVIGHDVEIVVTEITRSGVKFGVVAPPSLQILRGEVHDAIEEANRAAASAEFVEPGTNPAAAEVTVATDASHSPTPSADVSAPLALPAEG